MSDAASTLIDVLIGRAASDPQHLATIANDRGRWVPTTARELIDSIAALAVGLADDGLSAGDRVAIVLGNVPEWLTIDLAVQAAGGVAVAVPVSTDDELLAATLQAVEPTVVVVDDAILSDRVASLIAAGRLDPIRRVLHLGTSDSGASGIDDVTAKGSERLSSDAAAFTDLVARRDPDAPATVTFTGGSGGTARPVVHSGRAQLANAQAVATTLGLEYVDVAVTSLPPSHPLERGTTLYPALAAGSVLAYPEADATIGWATHEVRPTVAHISVDRLRAAATSIQGRFYRNKGVKRLAARWWRNGALERIRAGKEPSKLAVRMVGAPALRGLGWDNLRYVMVAGGEVPTEVVNIMNALGLAVYCGYATTEAGLIAVGQPDADDSLPVVEGVAVSEEAGQLTVQVAGLASGYADGTAIPCTSTGALVTGDLGVSGGSTVVLGGPASSLTTLADGRSIIAAQVERKLRDSPFIALAVVRAAESGLHATIEIDGDSVGEWASERTLLFTTFSSLVELDEVEALIADEVARLAPDVERHDLLARPFQQGRDITRTGRNIYRAQQRADAERASNESNESTAAVDRLQGTTQREKYS